MTPHYQAPGVGASDSELMHNHDIYGEDWTGSLTGAVISLDLVSLRRIIRHSSDSR
jgi:hypothetical protein